MKMLYRNILLFILPVLLFCAVPVHADQKEDAMAMVKAAALFLKTNGSEKTLDALNNPKGPFVKGDLYVFAYDTTGILVANSLKQSLVGMNLMELPDSKGKKFRKEIVERAIKEGSGWVDYVTQHPKTSELEEKTTYFQKEGDLVLACGVYKK